MTTSAAPLTTLQRWRRPLAYASAVLLPPLLLLAPALYGQVPLGFDAAGFYVPLLRLAGDLVRSGASVLWTDRIGTGFPLLASMQVDLLYPPTWLLLLLPDPARGLTALMALHLALLGAGGVRLGRAVGLSWLGAATSGVLLAASPAALGLLNRPGFVWPLAWAPFAFAAVVGRDRVRPVELGGALGLAACVSLQMAAAHAAIVLALLAIPRGARRPALGAAPWGTAALVGIALSAPAVAVFAELLPWSDRAGAVGGDAALSNGLTAPQLLQWICPGLLGLWPAALPGAPELAGATTAQVQWMTSPAGGVLALVLALVGGLCVRRLRGVLALLLLLFVVSSPWIPGVALLWQVPPLSLVRFPAKAWQAGLPLLPLLAGAGVDVLRRHRALLRALLAGAGVVAIALLVAVHADATARALVGLSVAVLALALVTAQLRKARLALAALAMIESALWASGAADFAPVAPAESVVAAGIHTALGATSPHGVPRVTTLWARDNPLLPQVNGRANKAAFEAAAGGGNALLGARIALDVAFTGVRLRGPHELWARAPSVPHLMQTLGAAGAVVGADLPVPAGMHTAAVFADAGVQLLVPDVPVSAAQVARRVVFVEYASDIDAVMHRADFDPAQDAVLAGVSTAAAGDGLKGSGTATVVARSATRVELAVGVEHAPALVWTRDALGPGWRVVVDGVEALPLAADGGLRGVAVAPGAHTVVWEHHASSLWGGAAVSGACVCILVVMRVRRRRRGE